MEKGEKIVKERDIFDSISPIDYRYWDKEVAKFLSENGFTEYKLRVELALIKTLHKRGICSKEVVGEVEKACGQVTTYEVYAEEGRIKHDIRALVNCIQNKVSDKAKPFIHMTATSFDISDTANAARFRDVQTEIVIPELIKLEQILIEITLREAETLQIGRTHGQHAEPITFGFAMVEYVSRLGDCIQSLKNLVPQIIGKFSGAVGAYNASSLFFDDPEKFEEEVLSELGLKPAEYSTQIIPPEPLMRMLSELISTGGILANLSRDMRNLQRTEIGEIGEKFQGEQVGSSTMPHKRNPISFENVESIWKILIGDLITVYLNQISEHQRDLTNSAAARIYGEIVGYLVSITKRLTKTMKKLKIDKKSIGRNIEIQKKVIAAEPLYIVLAANGYTNAHEKVRQLTIQAQQENKDLIEIVYEDTNLRPYFNSKIPQKQKRMIVNPVFFYTGIAAEKAKEIANRWADILEIEVKI